MLSSARKTVAASVVALALLAGSALLGNTALGSSASAAEPGAVFYGYVVSEQGSPLPKRIRAIADGGVVCGSAELQQVGLSNSGFYAMTVFSADMREGCPTEGGRILFRLVYGYIDDGIPAGQSGTFASGAVTELHLFPSRS